jgi:adenylate cyclase
LATSVVYSFGRFKLDPATRQLVSDGQPVAMGARAFDVLIALIERRERLVTKDELLDLVWPGLVVEENNLQVQVSTLRKLLGADSISTIPGRGYQFVLPLEENEWRGMRASAVDGALALPDRPSIAVLPFANMTGDPDEDYFVDGVTEDIIMDLSRFRSLFVIARSSTFSYKNKSADLGEIGKELGVRYLLEGSFRKSADRIRLTAQLIDASSAVHIWAERYDRTRSDIFVVQDEITQAIVTAIAPQIDASERDKARRRRPESLSAYEIGLRAISHIWEGLGSADHSQWDEAIRLAREALKADPRSTLALNVIGFGQYLRISYGTAADPEDALREGLACARQAIQTDPSDSSGYLRKGLLVTFGYKQGGIAEGLADLRKAHELNPNDVSVLSVLGWYEAISGNASLGIQHLQNALRLAPRSPLRRFTNANLSVAYSLAKDYAQTVRYASLAINEAPRFALPHTMLAMAYVGLGDLENAKASFERARELAPEYVRKRLEGEVPYQVAEDRLRYTTFQRIAGGLEDPRAADALR